MKMQLIIEGLISQDRKQQINLHNKKLLFFFFNFKHNFAKICLLCSFVPSTTNCYIVKGGLEK